MSSEEMNWKGKYFDCDILLGLPRVPLAWVRPDLHDLLAEMKRLDISKALVRHRACIEVSPNMGNRMLMEEISGSDSLMPVWMFSPEGTGRKPGLKEIIGKMFKEKNRAAWMRPVEDNFSLEPWCSGRIIKILEEVRIPLFLSFDDISGRELHEILKGYPNLPVIVLRAPRMGRNEILYPLLRCHHNLYVAVTPFYSVYQGIEDLCKEFGSERLVFGTGYPEVEGGVAVCMLNYADISNSDKDLIARGNLERLLEEVKL